MDKDFQSIIEEFSKLPMVESITLGGSRSTGKNNINSDYDIYIYTTSDIPLENRKIILSKYCNLLQLDNRYWELGDDATMNCDINIDIMYRNIFEFDKTVYNVVVNHTAQNGYTTCMWNNLLNCKILFDRNDLLTNMQNKYNIPYPKELKENIIKHNFRLLHGAILSYDNQIEKAVLRGDIVSINHRITEFLASYFDIIFALNEITHFGEKRLISICKSTCKTLPNNFEENISNLLNFKNDINSIIENIILELKKVL